MATDAVVREPGGEWLAAFEVQQRFLQHSGPSIESLDYSGRCKQMGEVGGDCIYRWSGRISKPDPPGMGYRWPPDSSHRKQCEVR